MASEVACVGIRGKNTPYQEVSGGAGPAQGTSRYLRGRWWAARDPGAALGTPILKFFKRWVCAHRWEEGWFEGEIKFKVTMSTNANENGKYACKYSDRRKPVYHDLFVEDYGIARMWVIVKKG